MLACRFCCPNRVCLMELELGHPQPPKPQPTPSDQSPLPRPNRYVLKSQMKELLELEAASKQSVEEAIEEERAKVEAKTPITLDVSAIRGAACCSSTKAGVGMREEWANAEAKTLSLPPTHPLPHPFYTPLHTTPSPPWQTFAVWMKEKEAAKRMVAEEREAERKKRGAMTGVGLGRAVLLCMFLFVLL